LAEVPGSADEIAKGSFAMVAKTQARLVYSFHQILEACERHDPPRVPG